MQIMVQRSGQIGSHITPTSISYELRKSEVTLQEPGKEIYRRGPAWPEGSPGRNRIDGLPAMAPSQSAVAGRRLPLNALEAHDSNAFMRIHKLQRAGARAHMGTAEAGRGRPAPGALAGLQKGGRLNDYAFQEQALRYGIHDEQIKRPKANGENIDQDDEKAEERLDELDPVPSDRTKFAQRLLSVDYRSLGSGEVQATPQVLASRGPADYRASRLEGVNNLKYDDTQLLLSRYMVRQDP